MGKGGVVEPSSQARKKGRKRNGNGCSLLHAMGHAQQALCRSRVVLRTLTRGQPND